MTVTPIKRITLEITPAQHQRLKNACDRFETTQVELLGYIIDITLANSDVVKAPVEAMVKKRKLEEAKAREIEEKTRRFIDSLPADTLERILSGEVDMTKL